MDDADQRGSGGGTDPCQAVCELDAAHVQLRVAEQELETQRRHVDELVAGSSAPRTHRGGVAGQVPVAAAFAQLCRLRADEDGDPQALLARIATLCRVALPAAAGLSITLGHPKAPELVATESSLAQAADGAQHRADEGPCVEAHATRRVQLLDDTSDEPRWPTFARLAGELGVGSVLGAPILSGPDVLGVLNVYAGSPDAFDEVAIEVVELLSAAVAVVIQDARERAALRALNRQLQEAMTSRAEIEQAKGMLMAAHRCDADEAFRRLVATSRNTNTKLRDVAAQVVAAARASAVHGSDPADGPAPQAGTRGS